MWMRTGDPLHDFDSWDAEQEHLLSLLPVCVKCGEPIQDDYMYELDGEDYCEDCAFDWLSQWRREVEIREVENECI